MRKISLSLACFVLLVGLVGAPLRVFAHGDEHTQDTRSSDDRFEARKVELEELRAEQEKKLTELKARRCEFVKSRLEFSRDQAAAIREHRKARYDHIVDSLNSLADRLDVQGIDTTGLRGEIEDLSGLIATYSDTYTHYETELQQSINAMCSSDEIDTDAIKEARQLLVQLKSNAESIHTFFEQQLKPELAKLRAAIVELRQSAEENSSTTDEQSTTNQE